MYEVVHMTIYVPYAKALKFTKSLNQTHLSDRSVITLIKINISKTIYELKCATCLKLSIVLSGYGYVKFHKRKA